jgi:hypothetical protein
VKSWTGWLAGLLNNRNTWKCKAWERRISRHGDFTFAF